MTFVKTVALAFACVLLGAPLNAQDAVRERVLPIRQAALIRAIASTTTGWIDGVSLSPTGTVAVYGARQCVPRPGLLGPECARGYWLVDVASGHRKHVGGVPNQFPIQELQWSPDGQEFAAMSVGRDTLTLKRWTILDPSEPHPEVFTGSASPLPPSGRLVAWRWLADRGELVVGFAETFERPRAATDGVAPSFTWFASQEVERQAARVEDAIRGLPLPLRIVVLNTRARTIVSVSSPGNSLFGGVRSREVLDEWELSADGRFLFVKSWNPIPTKPIASAGPKQLKDLHMVVRGDPATLAAYGAQGDLYRLNLETHALEAVGQKTPGRIGSVAEVPGTDDIAIVEQDLRLGKSIYNANWGRLKRVKNRTSVGTVVTEGVAWEARIVASDRAGIVYHMADRQPECAIYEVDVRSGARTRISPEGLSACEAGVSRDGKRIVAALENVSTPPHLHRWTSSARRWERIGHEPISDTKHALGFGSIEFVTWRSGDNRFAISGMLIKPPQFTAGKRYPLVIITKGGSPGVTGVTRNTYRLADWYLECGGAMGAVLAKEGYLVLVTNHRGSQQMGLEEERYQFGRFGDHVEYDIGAGIDWLVANGWADPAKVGICGHSMGGNEVAFGLANTKRFGAAVVNDPWFLSEVMQSREDPLTRNSRALFSAHRSGLWTSERVYAKDPVETPWADPFKMQTPLLMRWASEGTEASGGVNALDASDMWRRPTIQKMSYALTRNGVPFEMIIDAEGHGVQMLEYAIEWNSRVVQWFDYFLLGKGENPLPAMKSPIDYSEQVKNLKKSRDTQ